MSEENTNEQVNGEDTATHEGRRFTQEEVDGIVQKRISRYADYDSLKSEVDALRKEKEEGEWRSEVETEVRADVLKDVNKRLLAAEAHSQALAANFLYPEDALRYIDDEALEYTEEGYVQAESVKAQINRLTEERPALVRSEKKATARDVGLGVGGSNKPLTGEEAFVSAVSG